MKIGRNDPCWCGSGKKYKVCHADFDEKLAELKAKGEKVPPHSLIKTKEQLEGIRKAGKLNTEILDMVAENIHAGMSTEDINKLVHEYTIAHGGIPAPLNYCGSVSYTHLDVYKRQRLSCFLGFCMIIFWRETAFHTLFFIFLHRLLFPSIGYKRIT